jgi:hypothetical protein
MSQYVHQRAGSTPILLRRRLAIATITGLPVTTLFRMTKRILAESTAWSGTPASHWAADGREIHYGGGLPDFLTIGA